ncbi:KIF-binding protein [Aethina tumida]|uniref:KIF-binding protein n=1 Tax=Aethina tumida TaxID=116153 RepID=UPI002149621E|nr:KIF-binding protein [Aethina tumida]
MALMPEVLNNLKVLFNNLIKCPKYNKKDNENQQSGDSNISGDNWEKNVENIIETIDEHLPKVETGSDDFIRLLSMKASILYEKAKIYLNSEMLDKTQDVLINALNIIEHFAKNPKMTFLYLKIINHLSYSLSRKGDTEKAKELLEKVLEEDIETPILFNTEDLFNDVETDQTYVDYKFNKLMVNNMQILSWIYGKLGLYDSHTAMQHKTLQRLLEYQDFDILQWTSKCCRLASLFLTQCQWVHARYHLSAAQTLLDHVEPADTNESNEILKGQAELSKSFMSYAMHLFSMSKKMMMENAYYSGFSNFTPNFDEGISPEEPLPESFEFDGIDVKILQIPASQITTTAQARRMAQYVNKWIQRIQLYYNLRDFPSEFINAVLDLSEVYKHLSFFETDLDFQYTVQRTRSDSLENLCECLREIRPNSYISISVDLLREMAEVQIDLMTINLKRLHQSEKMSSSSENIKKRVAAVSAIHKKLEEVSEILNGMDLVTVYENPEIKNVMVVEEHLPKKCSSQGDIPKINVEEKTSKIELEGNNSLTAVTDEIDK